MSSTVESMGNIKRKLSITVPQTEVDADVQKQLVEASQKARLPGFRPGKAPIERIRQQFGPAIRSEVITKLIEKSYGEAIAQHTLKPAGMPKITIEEASFKDGDLKYTADLEVFPEFKVQGLAEIELVKTHAEVTEADLDKMFENLRKQHIKWEETKKAAKEGDRVIIDFEGFKNNEAFAGGNATDFKLILGSKNMIPGFEEGVIGKKADEAFDLELTFPEDYHVEDLKGQPAVFKIKVKMVETPILPEVNEEFAKLFEVETLEQLKKEVKMNMERELDFALKAKLKNQVTENLLKTNTIDLPEALVQQEAQHLAEVAKERMKAWGQKNVPAMPLELFTEEAKKRVALGLIMAQIIEEFNIKPDQARVDAMVEKMASIYDNPSQIIELFKHNKARMAEIEQVVLEEQVVDQVSSLAKVKSETKTFDEIMQNNTAAMANMLPQG